MIEIKDSSGMVLETIFETAEEITEFYDYKELEARQKLAELKYQLEEDFLEELANIGEEKFMALSKLALDKAKPIKPTSPPKANITGINDPWWKFW